MLMKLEGPAETAVPARLPSARGRIGLARAPLRRSHLSRHATADPLEGVGGEGKEPCPEL